MLGRLTKTAVTLADMWLFEYASRSSLVELNGC